MKIKYFDFRLLIGLFIIIILLFYFYRPISEHIYSLNFVYISLGLLVLLSVVTIKQFKWYLLLGEIRSWKLAFKSYFTGQFVNEIAPIGAGDLTKAYMVRKYSKKPFGYAFSLSYMERVLDITVLGTFAIFSSLFLFLTAISSYISFMFVLVFILALGFLLTALFPVKIAITAKKIMMYLRKIIRIKLIEKIVFKLEIFILKISKDFQESLKEFMNRKLFILAMLLMAFCDWVLEGVCQFFLLNSLGFTIPIMISIGIVSISWLVSIPSMIPGGLGIRETILSLLFMSFGVPFSAALASVLIYRVLVLLIFGSGALISLKIKNT